MPPSVACHGLRSSPRQRGPFNLRLVDAEPTALLPLADSHVYVPPPAPCSLRIHTPCKWPLSTQTNVRVPFLSSPVTVSTRNYNILPIPPGASRIILQSVSYI